VNVCINLGYYGILISHNLTNLSSPPVTNNGNEEWRANALTGELWAKNLDTSTFSK